MYFRPIDEMSLRQLFSSDYAKNELKLAYIGPVIGPTNSIETSPDALVLDMRKSPYKTIRCEFKFVPNSKNDFSHNGIFDLAVIWGYGSISREQLKNDLLEQNGCSEIIALSDVKAFYSLLAYEYKTVFSGKHIEQIDKVILKRELHSVVAAYIAAMASPKIVNNELLINYLDKKLPSVKQMKPQGKGNIISAFIQTNPPLIKHMYGNNYCWNIDFDSKLAATEIGKIILNNFKGELPEVSDIRTLCVD